MKIYITSLLLLPILFFGQTKNYVKTTTYKQASVATISAPTPSQAQVDITYFDGLSRPIQQIASQQSNSGKDIVTHIGYDSFGRQSEEYLPYASTQNTAAYIDPTTLVPALIDQYKTNYGTANDNPFSSKIFELSPLERVTTQAAPGNDWRLNSGHEIKTDYQSNTATEVIFYSVSIVLTNTTYIPTLTISSLNSGNYNAGQLYKTITKNENWLASQQYPLDNTTEEFKDKKGHIVLKRTYDSGIKYDTYYVYDPYDNLTYVIPPKATGIINVNYSQADLSSSAVVNSGASLQLTASNSITLTTGFNAVSGSTFNAKIINSTTIVLDNLCYQYVYDYQNRLVEKKLPGKQWEFIVYDKLDRPVATGPAASPFSDLSTVGWLITKYDAFNRPIYTGWMTGTAATSAGRKTLQDAQNNTALLYESKQTSGTIDGIPAFYSNTIAPTAFKLLTVNYYDNYTFPSSPAIVVPTTVEGQNILTTSQVKALPTASWVRVLTTSTAILGETTASFYDYKARSIRSYTQNYLGGYTYTDTNLDFAGLPQYTITYHKRISTVAELKTKEVFTYSPQGRLLTHTHQINTDTPQLLASNTYNELGQLISKGVGNISTASKPLQKVDFAYNIRGWLTDINKTDALAQGTDPKDLFAFKINYTTTASGISGVKALYNGNIAETYWNTADIQKSYGYKYDNLNRLNSATFQKAGLTTNAYDETLSYDLNGNIMSIIRNGNNETAQQIDNLVYSYGTNNNTNQLTKVVDNAPTLTKTNGFTDSLTNNADDYSYDVNGNLTTDNNKNITAITYNHLNLPLNITFGSSGNIAYLYNAAGQKLQKVVTVATPASTTTTDYLGSYQYLNTNLQFFPTAEGYVEPITASTYKYVFQYKDHLGNVRLSYKDSDGSNDITSSEILEENNYYPFGLKQTSNVPPVVVSTNPALKYKYNGKELQDENIGGNQLNLYDYGARNYDPALGRWMNIDPLAEVSRRWSPYNYAYNNPVFFVDPDGMEVQDFAWGTTYTGKDAQNAFAQLQSQTSSKSKNDKGDDIIFRNNKNEELGRIVMDGEDQYVNIDTDKSVNKPITADLKYLMKELGVDKLDAVGFGIELSGTAILGVNYGIEAVYFLTGKDAGQAHLYTKSGGNIGIEGSLGGYIFGATKKDQKSVSATSWLGTFNSYSAGWTAGLQYFWSSTTGKTELYPGQRGTTDWQGVAVTGAAYTVGFKFGGKWSTSDYEFAKQGVGANGRIIIRK